MASAGAPAPIDAAILGAGLEADEDVSFETVCSVVELIDVPIMLLDLDGRIRYLNPAYERLLGKKAADLRGRPVDAVLPATGRGRRMQFVRGAALFKDLVARGSGRAVFPNERPDGTIVQIEVTAKLFRRRDHASSWVLGLVNDLGKELVQLDTEIAALRQLAAAGDDLLINVVRVSRRLIGARYAAIHVVEDGKIVGMVHDGVSERDAMTIGRRPEGRGVLQAMMTATGPVRIRDVSTDHRSEGVPEGHPHITSLLAVPMQAGPTRYGHLYFGDKLDHDEFTVVDERLAEVFAIHGAIAIRDERERSALAATIETLETRERQLEAAQRIGFVGSWERDLATDRLTWSSEAHRLFGLDPAQMPPTLAAFLTHVHSEDRRRAARTLDEMADGDPAPIDYRIIRADGSERVVHEVSEVIRDSDGKPRTHLGATQDITERVAGEAERARLASALAQSADGVIVFDPDLKVAYANPAAGRMYGYDAADLIGRPLTIIDSGLQEPGFFSSRYNDARAGRAWTGTIVNRHRNGSLVEAEVSITPMFDAAGWLTGIVESHRDISARVAAERERERLASAIEQAPDPIWILEPDGTIEYVNQAATRLYGYAADELIGGKPSILNSGVESAAFWAEMWAVVRAGRPWTGTIVNRTKDGSLVQIVSTISPILDGKRHLTALIAADRDVTRERALESDLERQARERDSIEAALRGINPSATPEEIATAACVEIVRLSDVGSAAVFDLTPGAETLLGVAGRMSSEIRPGVRIPEVLAESLRARTVGGAWIHGARKDPIPGGADFAQATGLQTAAYAPFSTSHGTVGVIGIGSHDAGGAGHLVDRLSALAVFGSLLGATLGPGLDARHRGSEAQALVRANLDEAAFASFFQPIVALQGGSVVGYEALTRFSGHQLPALAFAAATRAGLGIELEAATLARAVAAADVLPAEAFLSLNASPTFIGSGELGRILTGQTRPIVLEITEHEPIADYTALRRSLAALAPQVRLAVDDAGAGFASFRHILELAPDFVKLDIGLVRGIATDPARQALVAGMAFFASERHLRLIAEGIETEAELEAVRRLGVELGQGFLLGRPQPPPRGRRSRHAATAERIV